MFFIATIIAIVVGVLLLGASLIIIPFWLKPENKWIYIVTVIPGAIVLIIGIIGTIGIILSWDEVQSLTVNAEEHLGEPAPELPYTLIDEEGEFQISQHNDKVVLINFWATWCPPCVEEMPDLSKLAENYSENLVVLCLSDEETETVINWIEENEGLQQDLGFVERGSVKEPFTQMFTVRPMSYVIDREGKLQESIRGARSYEEFEEYVEPYIENQ